MENIFLRFPQMGESIIRLLDNKSLVLCREVNKKWKNFIDCQKILSVRMIQRSTVIPRIVPFLGPKI